MARDLGVRAIHIAERDTQWSMARRRPGEFVNTWSVPGFVEEALPPADLGWGSHGSECAGDARRPEPLVAAGASCEPSTPQSWPAVLRLGAWCET